MKYIPDITLLQEVDPSLTGTGKVNKNIQKVALIDSSGTVIPLGGGSSSLATVAYIDADTVVSTFDSSPQVYIVDVSGGDVDLTLPSAASNEGQEVVVKLGVGGNTLNILPNGADTINDGVSHEMAVEGSIVHMVCDGDGWVFVGSAGSYTASRVLISDTNGAIDASSVSDTALGYLQNVTSDIQNQLNNKLGNPIFDTFTPTVTLVGGAGNTTPVYSTNTGRYVEIGQMVYVDVLLDGDGGAEGAGTGVFTVALPAESNSAQPDYYFHAGWALNNASEYYLLGKIAASASVMSLRFINGTTGTDFTGAHQNNATRRVRLKFCYEKASA